MAALATGHLYRRRGFIAMNMRSRSTRLRGRISAVGDGGDVEARLGATGARRAAVVHYVPSCLT